MQYSEKDKQILQNQAKANNLIDGKRYLVTYILDDGSKDSVAAVWVAEHLVFSHSMGSLSLNQVTKIE